MLKKIIIGICIIVVIVIGGAFIWYNSSIGEVNKNDTEEINVEIEKGLGSVAIAKQLKNQNLIKNVLAFRIYVKINNINNFKAGNYKLSKSMNLKEITEILQTGVIENKDEIEITFVEGKNMRWIAKKISEETKNTENDVYNLLKNEEYIDTLIDKYWFITEEIKNSNIYYPLEGYLFPDTYRFENKNISVEKIFETLLNQMDKKLSQYKEKIQKSKYSVHQILTVASIIENEAVFDKDRKDVASVIYNRLDKKMSIGSDVTTYYAFKIDMGSRDLRTSELNKENPYNTRGPNMEGKLPVGPISMVGLSSIQAAVSPNETSYLYFVADKDGNVYFTRTYNEHLNKVSDLKKSGLWIEF